VVGVATLRLDDASSEGHALRTGQPMTSSDINMETRFQYADFLKDNGVRALANVAIIGGTGKPPFGILQVDSREPREFTESDVLFLRSYANLLAASVSRLRALGEARAKNVELEQWLEECRRNGEHHKFLSRELDHRAKNILAVVRAVVRLTRADDVPSFVEVIDGRLAAMARAHTLLSADHWSGAGLYALLSGELAAYLEGSGSSPRAKLDGPPIILPAKAVQPFSIAIHEMATNAMKYGALASSTGRLAVTWRVQRTEDDVLHVRWTEMGGPAIQGPPVRRSFGSRILTDTVRAQLGGTIFMDWKPTGLVCDFTIPLHRNELSKSGEGP
jgi:two-component sensor histidine kinase